MSTEGKVQEFALDMAAEVSSRAQQPQAASPDTSVDNQTSTEIAARIGELMKRQGVDDEMNPLAAEKVRRDLEYQRQMEQFPLPGEAPPQQEPAAQDVSRLEQMQDELEGAKKEVAKWKTYYGRSENRVGDLKSRLDELSSRVAQIVPQVDIRQITGKNADDVLTAQEIVNLLMSQSQAFGSRLAQMKDEMVLAIRNPDESRIPADVEAELVQAHPWIANLPLPQKERAMSDLLGALGRPVAPQPTQPVVAQASQTKPAAISEPARAQVRQAAFIEPSNKGSAAELHAVVPERQAFNEKVAKLKEALGRQGGAKEAENLLASLGAGVVDESEVGYLRARR